MVSDETSSDHASGLSGRRFLTCSVCGWVHYAMTAAEKAANDRLLERYRLSEAERYTYESAFRQCLRCESPLAVFREADANDLARAETHLVTPVFLESETYVVKLS